MARGSSSHPGIAGDSSLSSESSRDVSRQIRVLVTSFEKEVIPMLRAVVPVSAKEREKANELEAQTRKYLIDQILRILGWDVDDPTSIVIEDRIEPNGRECRVSSRKRANFAGLDTIIA